MKYTTTIIFLTLCSIAISQEDKHSLSLSYSNNGNIKNEVHKFYFNPIHEYSPGDDVSFYKESSFKLNLNYTLKFKENWGVGLSGGYGHRKDDFNISNQPDSWTGDQSQKYYAFGINGQYYWRMDRLELGTGLELPFTIISNHIQNIYQDEPNQQMHYAQETTGGFSFGINSVTSIKIFLTKFLYLNAKASFGYTKLNLGEITSQYFVSQDPVIYPDTPYEYDNKYVKNYFANPELNFGVGCSF